MLERIPSEHHIPIKKFNINKIMWQIYHIPKSKVHNLGIRNYQKNYRNKLLLQNQILNLTVKYQYASRETTKICCSIEIFLNLLI